MICITNYSIVSARCHCKNKTKHLAIIFHVDECRLALCYIRKKSPGLWVTSVYTGFAMIYAACRRDIFNFHCLEAEKRPKSSGEVEEGVGRIMP